MLLLLSEKQVEVLQWNKVKASLTLINLMLYSFLNAQNPVNQTLTFSISSIDAFTLHHL